MKARVAHIVPSDRIAFFLLSAQLAELSKAGFDVTVVCGRVAYTDELERRGIRVIHVPFAREIAPLIDLRCAFGLFRVLRRERFDIVHSHNPKGGLIGPLIAALAGGALVVHTVHGFLFNENSSAIYRLLALGAERWTAYWCDHLLFQSGEDYAFASDHSFKRPQGLHLIGNGVDHRRFDPGLHSGSRELIRAELEWDEEHLVVGIVGRLVADKGFREFFAMAERIAARFPCARFLVVGITEREQSNAVDPRRLSEERGIADRCQILEQRQDMPELYASMDVAVLPSYREGIPRALMEAAAMGVAVTASDIRGCREVVVDGESGILFPLRDLDALIQAVARLLSDSRLRRQMGEAGRRRILANYTEGRTARRLMAFYDEALADRAGALEASAQKTEIRDVGI